MSSGWKPACGTSSDACGGGGGADGSRAREISARLQHLVDQHADVDDCAAQLRIVFARRLQLSTTCCDEYGASERATLLC
jgi:hypothetical protein